MKTIAQGLAHGLPRVGAALLLAAVAGCATTGEVDRHTAGAKDPLEPFNRKMFAFNDTLDTYALKPVATAYQTVLPSPVRTGVHNFFGNFSDVWSAVNQLLQGKVGDSARMTFRVVTNTTLGIGGLFDPASSLGLERKSEDLGQTFGRWGAGPGAYLVLPLFGASDVRDAIALPADSYVTPALLVPSTWQKIGVDTLGIIDTRAGLLGASQMLDDLAFDRYTFMRDAYVAHRRSLVYDGDPPDEPDADDDSDAKPAPAPAGAASGAQSGLKPAVPARAASEAATSMSSDVPATVGVVSMPVRVAFATEASPVPPTPSPAPAPVPTPAPVPPGGVTPAPLPASAPTLPVPPSLGPAPLPPPPASSPRA